jgi:hypothetical protein
MAELKLVSVGGVPGSIAIEASPMAHTRAMTSGTTYVRQFLSGSAGAVVTLQSSPGCRLFSRGYDVLY